MVGNGWQLRGGGTGAGGSSGKLRKCDSGLGFDSGLHGKDACATGNTSRGSGWRDGAGERRTTSNLHGEKAGKKGKRGWRGSSPQGEAPVAACGNRRAVKQ
jgi:hypothetical protein